MNDYETHGRPEKQYKFYVILTMIFCGLKLQQVDPANTKRTYKNCRLCVINRVFIQSSIGYYCTYRKLSQPDPKNLSLLFRETYCVTPVEKSFICYQTGKWMIPLTEV